MKTGRFELELITRCFLGGANPRTDAELRAPSIRAQLRWWFRTLGGFCALAPRTVRQQENEIFGVAAGESGTAGKLRLQIQRTAPVRTEVIGPVQVDGLPDEKYILWPFGQQQHGQDNPRACLLSGTTFQLRVHWCGDPELWPSILGLVAVLGHLGSLGTRSRRAMGALGFVGNAPDLAEAMKRFCKPSAVLVRQISPAGYTSNDASVAALAAWLREWRAYGRTGQNTTEQGFRGFSWAKQDHDVGAGLAPANQPVFRAALGLPIGQRFKGNRSVNWEFGNGTKKGRFASPVILRPYRITSNQWKALVLFVDAHRWPVVPTNNKPRTAYLNGLPRAVSLDLYDEMKRKTPTPFP